MSSEVALGGPVPGGAPAVRRWIWWLLVAGQALLALSLLRQWLNAGTYRLYLDKRRAAEVAAPHGTRERFVLRGDRVDPQILTAENERLAFPIDFPWPTELRVQAVPSRRATIEIAIVQGITRRVLSRRTLSEATEVAQPLPATTGVLELANEGELRWSDPRLVQEPDLAPCLLGLLALLALTGLRPGVPPLPFRLPPWARTAVLGGLTAAIAAGLCLVVLETGLRVMGDRLPSWITAQRLNLGEVHPDPRWQNSARYGPRLAPRLRTVCEWRHGDIVRLGYLPPDLVRHPAYRFPFVTDAEGFRNSEAVSLTPVVAALGDSFTDAMTLPVELGWPARLAHHLGVSVRNYGTAGFGPGQELRALEEYVLVRRPRFVVVGFFAGNDLQDAERLERVERGGGPPSPGLGWRFKDVVARFDQLYLTSLYEGAATLLRDRAGVNPSSPPRLADYSGESPTDSTGPGPGFDRGLFTVPVGGRAVRFAFLPPYLNCLKLSSEQLQASRGWELTRGWYREMDRELRAQGSRLGIVFIPSKAQVYLPLLEASLAHADLQAAFRSCFRDQAYAPSLEVMMANRLALNALMRSFCAGEGILFLDLTTDLQTTLGGGTNVYFPDDSHWNAAGHETGAAAIARFLKARGLSTPGQEQALPRSAMAGREAGRSAP